MNKTSAIRYIIYRIAQEFNLLNSRGGNDTEFFNKQNNFTLEKCLLLPYIITIANGNKNFFLNGIFKESFFPHLDEKKVVVGNLEDGIFKPFNAVDLNLSFADDLLVYEFKDNEFDFDEDKKLPREESLFYNINYSIKFFIERRYPNFAALSTETLKKITSQNSAFEIINSLFSHLTVDDQKIVSYFNETAKESFYFTYLNERIEEDIDKNAVLG